MVLHNLYYTVQETLILQIPIMGGEDDYVTEACQQQLLQWKGKVLHGEFLKKAANGGEISLSFRWLLYGRFNTCFRIAKKYPNQ